MTEARIFRLGEALAPLPFPPTGKWPEGEPYQCLINEPGAQILVFAPRGSDHQTAHTRDEAYIAVAGKAVLEIGGEPHPFRAGDMAWLPKNVEHRFFDISPDFVTWVIFFG